MDMNSICEGTETPAAVARAIGKFTAVWIPEVNRYVLARPPADQVAGMIVEGRKSGEIADFCVTEGSMSAEEAAGLECEMRREIFALTTEEKADSVNEPAEQWFEETAETAGYSEKSYSLFGRVLRVRYPTAGTEFILHPPLAHLEIHHSAQPDHCFTVSDQNGCYGLQADGQWEGAWPAGREHVFVGQFFMKTLQKALKTAEHQWMAVLHAAGVADDRSCLLFAGDTGSGKSTLAALLMSRGYDVLADDFLPLEGETGKACRFPAAISVKKDALKLLSLVFPELKKAKAYHYPTAGKTVHYLPVERSREKEPRKVPCRALVFVEYKPDSPFNLEEMPPEDAFSRLVPDAWICQSPGNARRFLEWFSGLPCYRLVYSDNERVIEEVKKLLEDDKAGRK